MDKMREGFEAWVVSESERTGYAYMDKVLSKFGESYTTTWVDSSWQGWKASRASLCVELPVWTLKNGSDYFDYHKADDIKAICEEAGVTYK